MNVVVAIGVRNENVRDALVARTVSAKVASKIVCVIRDYVGAWAALRCVLAVDLDSGDRGRIAGRRTTALRNTSVASRSRW